MTAREYKRIEAKLRRQAAKDGLAVRKSRKDFDQGMFYVVDVQHNAIVAGYGMGAQFDLYDLATEAWAHVTPREMSSLSREAGV